MALVVRHFFVCLWVLGLFACGDKNVAEADRLNSMAYAFHYRNLDSTKVLAERALTLAQIYDAGWETMQPGEPRL